MESTTHDIRIWQLHAKKAASVVRTAFRIESIYRIKPVYYGKWSTILFQLYLHLYKACQRIRISLPYACHGEDSKADAED